MTRKQSPSRTHVESARKGLAAHVVRTPQGFESRMVDVGSKAMTGRSATARAVVCFPDGLLARVLRDGGPKGPIAEVARAAGILAAKRTGDLIPMCHSLGLDHVEIRFRVLAEDEFEVCCTAACSGRTGVEMEALVGASIAALTVYDMTKGLDHGIAIRAVELLEKSGGKSGRFVRAAEAVRPKAPSTRRIAAKGRAR